jgi:hypothetical protein
MTKNSFDLPYKINFNSFYSKVKAMRNAMHDNLVTLMMNYGVDEVDCVELGDCPIVISGNGDDCMTLDRMVLYNINDTKYIRFECSSSYTNDFITPNAMDIELLIGVYQWVLANEEELFNQEEEE